jgi:hypothetical protein
MCSVAKRAHYIFTSLFENDVGDQTNMTLDLAQPIIAALKLHTQMPKKGSTQPNMPLVKLYSPYCSPTTLERSRLSSDYKVLHLPSLA